MLPLAPQQPQPVAQAFVRYGANRMWLSWPRFFRPLGRIFGRNGRLQIIPHFTHEVWYNEYSILCASFSSDALASDNKLYPLIVNGRELVVFSPIGSYRFYHENNSIHMSSISSSATPFHLVIYYYLSPSYWRGRTIVISSRMRNEFFICLMVICLLLAGLVFLLKKRRRQRQASESHRFKRYNKQEGKRSKNTRVARDLWYAAHLTEDEISDQLDKAKRNNDYELEMRATSLQYMRHAVDEAYARSGKKVAKAQYLEEWFPSNKSDDAGIGVIYRRDQKKEDALLKEFNNVREEDSWTKYIASVEAKFQEAEKRAVHLKDRERTEFRETLDEWLTQAATMGKASLTERVRFRDELDRAVENLGVNIRQLPVGSGAVLTTPFKVDSTSRAHHITAQLERESIVARPSLIERKEEKEKKTPHPDLKLEPQVKGRKWGDISESKKQDKQRRVAKKCRRCSGRHPTDKCRIKCTSCWEVRKEVCDHEIVCKTCNGKGHFICRSTIECRNGDKCVHKGCTFKHPIAPFVPLNDKSVDSGILIQQAENKQESLLQGDNIITVAQGLQSTVLIRAHRQKDNEYFVHGTVIGQKLISCAHSFQEWKDEGPFTAYRPHCKFVPIVFEIKDVVETKVPDVVIINTKPISLRSYSFRKPMKGEKASIFVYNNQGAAASSTSQHCMPDGHEPNLRWNTTYSSENGMCGAPIISTEDHNLIGIHRWGTNKGKQNGFNPVTDDWLDLFQKKGNGPSSM